MDDDQQQRYWFPYWTSPPPPPPRPPVRPQLSRRESRPSTQHQPTTMTSRGAASPQAQVSSSRASPSRAAPLAPIREPGGNYQLQRHPSSITPPAPTTAHESAPKQKDVIIIPVDKTVQEAADPKPQGKAKDKDRKTPKDRDKDKKKEEEEDVFDESAKKKSHGGEQGKLQKEIKAGVADMVHKLGSSSGHERAGETSVITLAGENKGASMKLGAKNKERHGHRLDDGREEEGGKGMTALINSNVQVINNSLLLQSSCSGGDPGVHLKLSAKPKSKDKQQQRASDGGGKATAASTTPSAAKK